MPETPFSEYSDRDLEPLHSEAEIAARRQADRLKDTKQKRNHDFGKKRVKTAVRRGAYGAAAVVATAVIGKGIDGISTGDPVSPDGRPDITMNELSDSVAEKPNDRDLASGSVDLKENEEVSFNDVE